LVLITIDTLRYDSFAGTPDRRSSMPRTRAYAGSGQTFENFFAASPTTQPTHASLMTGLHPWQHGVSKNGVVLEDKYQALAELLKAAGFETAAVVGSFPLHRRFGFAQGFDAYEDDFSMDLVGLEEWEGQAVEGGDFYSLGDRITRKALACLERARGPKQFFWFHYFDPHDPYGDAVRKVIELPYLVERVHSRDPRVREIIAEARRLYERDISQLDHNLDLLFHRLSEDSEEFENHVVLTADHGESWGEDGSLGHGNRLTRAQVQVPAVIGSPALEPRLRRDVAGSVDVFTTLLSLAGLAPGSRVGRDLTVPLAELDGAAFGMRTAVDPFWDVRLDGTPEEIDEARFFVVKEGVLYAGDAHSVAVDDRASQPPGAAVSRELQAVFQVFQDELRSVTAAELSDRETRDALESLGYAR
jgi:arylsulfatase A-like enzyme